MRVRVILYVCFGLGLAGVFLVWVCCFLGWDVFLGVWVLFCLNVPYLFKASFIES